MIKRVSHVISLALPDFTDSTVPKWIELIPAGKFRGRDGRGPYILDVQTVLTAFKNGGIDLPIDYDHQSLTAEAKAGPVPAAGWIKDLQERGGSIWGFVEWTRRAIELIVNKEYRFISPVFRHDENNRVLALEGAGLTHYPNLELQPVAHKSATSDGDNNMGDNNMIDLKPLAEALGAAPDADVQTLIEHANTLRKQANTPPKPSEYVPMEQYRNIVQELTILRQKILDEKVEAAVNAAMKDGKLVPAMRAWAEDYAKENLDGFIEWAKAAPTVLYTEDTQKVHKHNNNKDSGITLTPEDEYVCEVLGIDKKEFAKHKAQIHYTLKKKED